jgi:hypothetical protein
MKLVERGELLKYQAEYASLLDIPASDQEPR